jgi:hypothetical protein
MSFLRFLQPDHEAAAPAERPVAGKPEPETVRRITVKLTGLPPERAAFLAAFAYILTRVAAADLDVTGEEADEMARQVEAFGGVPEEEAGLIVGMAVHEAVTGAGTDDFYVTRRFLELSTAEQRQQLLHCLFAVAAPGDDLISFEENKAIREISDELGFTLSELNEVRREYAERMAVVQMARSAGEGSSAS